MTQKEILDICRTAIALAQYWQGSNVTRAWVLVQSTSPADSAWIIPLISEVCTQMAKSGCYEVWLGIESGSQKILNAMRKGITVNRIRAAVSLVKKSGIKAGGFFILGYPGETSEDRIQTMSLALSLPLDYVKFTIFIPQPGTEIFNRLTEEGKINDINSVIKCSDNEFKNNFTDISAQQLRKTHRDFSLRFYLRPRIITGILNEYNSISKINYLLHAAKQFIFNKRASW